MFSFSGLVATRFGDLFFFLFVCLCVCVCVFCPFRCLIVMFSGSCLALWWPCWERGSWLLCFFFWGWQLVCDLPASSMIVALPVPLLNHMMRNAWKGPYALSGQRMPWSGWSGRLLPVYRMNGYCSICQQTQNVQIRLHGCERPSGPSLFVYDIRVFYHTAHHLR